MSTRSVGFLLLGPLIAFFLPWAIPLHARRHGASAALFVLWVVGLAIGGLLWFGPGVLILLIAGIAGLLEGSRPADDDRSLHSGR